MHLTKHLLVHNKSIKWRGSCVDTTVRIDVNFGLDDSNHDEVVGHAAFQDRMSSLLEGLYTDEPLDQVSPLIQVPYDSI